MVINTFSCVLLSNAVNSMLLLILVWRRLNTCCHKKRGHECEAQVCKYSSTEFILLKSHNGHFIFYTYLFTYLQYFICMTAVQLYQLYWCDYVQVKFLIYFTFTFHSCSGKYSQWSYILHCLITSEVQFHTTESPLPPKNQNQTKQKLQKTAEISFSPLLAASRKQKCRVSL